MSSLVLSSLVLSSLVLSSLTTSCPTTSCPTTSRLRYLHSSGSGRPGRQWRLPRGSGPRAVCPRHSCRPVMCQSVPAQTRKTKAQAAIDVGPDAGYGAEEPPLHKFVKRSVPAHAALQCRPKQMPQCFISEPYLTPPSKEYPSSLLDTRRYHFAWLAIKSNQEWSTGVDWSNA